MCRHMFKNFSCGHRFSDAKVSCLAQQDNRGNDALEKCPYLKEEKETVAELCHFCQQKAALQKQMDELNAKHEMAMAETCGNVDIDDLIDLSTPNVKAEPEETPPSPLSLEVQNGIQEWSSIYQARDRLAVRDIWGISNTGLDTVSPLRDSIQTPSRFIAEFQTDGQSAMASPPGTNEEKTDQTSDSNITDEYESQPRYAAYSPDEQVTQLSDLSWTGSNGFTLGNPNSPDGIDPDGLGYYSAFTPGSRNKQPELPVLKEASSYCSFVSSTGLTPYGPFSTPEPVLQAQFWSPWAAAQTTQAHLASEADSFPGSSHDEHDERPVAHHGKNFSYPRVLRPSRAEFEGPHMHSVPNGSLAGIAELEGCAPREKRLKKRASRIKMVQANDDIDSLFMPRSQNLPASQPFLHQTHVAAEPDRQQNSFCQINKTGSLHFAAPKEQSLGLFQSWAPAPPLSHQSIPEEPALIDERHPSPLYGCESTIAEVDFPMSKPRRRNNMLQHSPARQRSRPQPSSHQSFEQRLKRKPVPRHQPDVQDDDRRGLPSATKPPPSVPANHWGSKWKPAVTPVPAAAAVHMAEALAEMSLSMPQPAVLRDRPETNRVESGTEDAPERAQTWPQDAEQKRGVERRRYRQRRQPRQERRAEEVVYAPDVTGESAPEGQYRPYRAREAHVGGAVANSPAKRWEMREELHASQRQGVNTSGGSHPQYGSRNAAVEKQLVAVPRERQERQVGQPDEPPARRQRAMRRIDGQRKIVTSASQLFRADSIRGERQAILVLPPQPQGGVVRR